MARENEIENRFAPLPSATVPAPTASPSATEVEGGDEGPTRNRKARKEKVYKKNLRVGMVGGKFAQ